MKAWIKILDRVTPGASRSFLWEIMLSFLVFAASVIVNRNLGAENRGLFGLVIIAPMTVITLATCQWERLLKGIITSKQLSPHDVWQQTKHYVLWLSLIFVPLGAAICLLQLRLPLELRALSAAYILTFPVIMLSLCLSSIYIALGSIDGQYSMRIAYQGSYFLMVLGLAISQSLSIPLLTLSYSLMWLISLLVGLSKKNKLLSHASEKAKPLTGLNPLMACRFNFSRPNFSPLKRAFFPYALETLSLTSDIWLLSFFSTPATIGHYVAIKGLMMPVGILSNALSSGSTARLDWTQVAVVRGYLFKTILAMSFLLVLLVCGGFLFGTSLLDQFLGKSFADGEWMLPWIALMVALNAIASQFHVALQLSGLEQAYLNVQSFEMIIRVLLLLLFGWCFATVGILIGLCLSALIKCCACLFFWEKSKTRST